MAHFQFIYRSGGAIHTHNRSAGAIGIAPVERSAHNRSAGAIGIALVEQFPSLRRSDPERLGSDPERLERSGAIRSDRDLVEIT